MTPLHFHHRPSAPLRDRPLAGRTIQEADSGLPLPDYPRHRAVTAPSVGSVELFRAVKAAIVVGCHPQER